MDDANFADLIARARDGDEEAVSRLLTAFEDDVRLMVRVRLPRALRSQFDSMDFVQAIWQSLFTGDDVDPVSFSNPRHFRGYLAGIAHFKVLEEYRRRTQSKKYELGREERIFIKRGGREEARDVIACDPTPSEQVQATDRLEQLMAGRPPVEVEIIRLRSAGLTFDEIAEKVGLNEKTVRRVIDSARKRLEDRP